MKKTLLILVAAGVGYAGYEFWQSPSVCDVDLRRELSSPDGLRRAVLYGMECGATVGFNTQIALVPAGRTFRPDGKTSFFSMSGKQDLSIAWRDDAVLSVDIPAGDHQIYRQEREADSITIQYRKAP